MFIASQVSIRKRYIWGLVPCTYTHTHLCLDLYVQLGINMARGPVSLHHIGICLAFEFLYCIILFNVIQLVNILVLNSQDLFLSYSLAFNLCTAVYFQCPFRWLLSICLFLFQVLGDGLHYDAMSINLFQFLLMSFGSNHTCSPHKNGIKCEVVDS